MNSAGEFFADNYDLVSDRSGRCRYQKIRHPSAASRSHSGSL